MTRVVFETATLQDAIKKADRIAPAKGAAFDKAAGIVLDLTPGDQQVLTVRSTNLEVFYTEWIDCLELEGTKPISWRFPSRLISGVVASLPIGSGKTVILEQKDNTIHLTSGRTKARFNLLDIEYYPIWTAFDPDGLTPCADLGGRLEQVEWAASKTPTDVPFCGVHLDGELAIATDRYRCAATPLKVGLEAPITVPGAVLSGVLKQTGEISIGVEGGQQLLLMPDEHTQIRSVIYGQKYPSVERVMRRDKPAHVTFKKSDLLEIMNRALVMVGSERFPSMQVFIGQEEIAVMCANREIGLLGDVIDVPGQATHNRLEIKFTPKNIMDALDKSPNEEITLGYNPDSAAGMSAVVHIDGGSGYEAWVAPRKDTGEQ